MNTGVSVELVAKFGEVMGTVLTREPLAAEEDFFEAGGDSLRAIEVIQHYAEGESLPPSIDQEQLQAELLLAIFDQGSPSAMAAVVERVLAVGQ